MGVLHLGHGKGTMGTSNGVHWTQLIENKVLIVLHIPNLDLQEEIKIPGNIITFHHLFNIQDFLHEVITYGPVMGLQLYLTENRKATVELLGIQNRCIPFDVSFLFQSFYPFKNRGRREVDFLGKLLDRQFCIKLKQSQQFYILIIQLFHRIFSF